MPYKFDTDKLKVGKENDKRVKLTDEQKYEIVLKSAEGFSQRALAREYNVSRRLIQFITDPKKYERHMEIRKDKSYYDKEKHKEYMKKHRDYKKELNEQGKLIE